MVRITFPQLITQIKLRKTDDYEDLIDKRLPLSNTLTKKKMLLVLSLLGEDPGRRSAYISTKTGISLKTLERYLAILKGCGLIEYREATKSGGYFFKFKNQSSENNGTY